MRLTQVRYFSHASIILSAALFRSHLQRMQRPLLLVVRIGLSFRKRFSSGAFVPCNDLRSVSGKTIAFGGYDGAGYLNDTWSFDGTSWTQITTQSAPPARAAAQMTYDSVAQKVVDFSAGMMEPITWAIHGFGMGRRCSGRRPLHPIILLLLPASCYFRTPMAGPMFLADSTATSISSPCGNGNGSDWRETISADCSIRPGFSRGCHEYVHRTGCYVWRSR